ncbi:type II secretion system minor pseudopilin GspK [Collimonas silvisoli]|uniref:type II secretion system minor pseudopilin GspK n=1 Tax=Collimonas silvisoli TaxID=2825884 RepID=UPI001B8D49AA|nr:type II secretion system minor pseudopilin GspK [Collimonas silvisoli]
MSKPLRAHAAQRGVAVVTALLLTTLAVTIVASLFWQQQVQVRSIENQRLQLQKDWIMRGALDWASMILRASGRQFDYDHLGQPWAAPLADTRLDQYVEDGQPADDAGDAILSGSIVDAQSRYNLNNLSQNGLPVPAEVAAFKRLLGFLRLPASLANPTAQAIANSQPVTTPAGQQSAAKSDSGTLPMLQVNDLLSVPGYTPAMVRQLQDFVVVLPLAGAATPINANTAPAEVLAARFADLSLSEANTLVAARRTAPFRSTTELFAQMTNLFGKTFSAAKNVATDSNFFLVYGKIRMGRAALNTVSLIQRPAGNRTKSDIVWIREQ